MTLKDASNDHKPAAGDMRVRNKTRARTAARKDQTDLRKMVLREQTCKQLQFTQAPPLLDLKVAPLPALLKPPGKENGCAKKEPAGDLPRLSCEDKTVRIRRKLEKIIHKKEEEGRAVELLQSLGRMRFSPAVLESTKICLTLEALKLMVGDETIIAAANTTLAMLRLVQGPKEREEVTNYTEWRNMKELEKQKQEELDRREQEEKLRVHQEKKREYEMKRKEYEKKKKEHERKRSEFEKKRKGLEKKEQNPQACKETGAEPAPEPEPIEGAAGGEALPSLRIGYWMDKLLSGVDQLSLLDKKVGRIQENVNTIHPKEYKPADKAKKFQPPTTRMQPEESVFDKELIMLTRSIQKIDIKEKPKEKISKPETTELPLKATIVIEPNFEKIKPILEHHTEYDTTIVIAHLKALSSMRFTVSSLQTTKAGIIVNNLRKSTQHPEVAEISKSLIKSWRKLLPSSQSTKESAAAEDRQSRTEQAKPKPSQDDIRDYCRKKLLSALASNKSLSDQCKLVVEQLADDIESAVFSRFNETNSKYRSQINSRYFNLVRNASLQENLLLGNLEPKEFATMNYEDLAPDQVKEARAKWTIESLKTVPDSHVADDTCTCRLCLPRWINP